MSAAMKLLAVTRCDLRWLLLPFAAPKLDEDLAAARA
jgi:hypothetical protein